MKRGALKEKVRSFGFQMAIFYLVTGLIIITLFGGVVYAVVSDLFVKEAISKTQMAIETSAGNLGEYIRHAKSLLNVTAQNAVLIETASSGTGENQQNVLKQLETIEGSDTHILGVCVILPNGNVIGSNRKGTQDSSLEMHTNKPCLSSERVDSYAHDDPWTVAISTPITSGTGEIIGMLVMDLDYCLFVHTLSEFDMGKSGNIFIVYNTGELVFHTDKKLLGTTSEPVVPDQNGYDAETNKLTHRFAVPGTDWTIVGMASLDSLTILKRQISDMVVFTGLLLFFALFIITVTVSKKLTTPLARLASNMEDIERLAELVVQSNDISEAAILTKSYNRMIQRIKQLMQELERKQSELRKNELDVLTSQINPHFLYNTLDTIVWLAEFRDNDKIIALTKSLAAFFRLSLNGGDVCVSLRDEIEHVKQYLFIQKERYEDKLTYSFEVSEIALVCMVPKIILQPIVENAIYHGIKPMDRIGHIRITASVDGEVLTICVCDNGVGFDIENGMRRSDKKTGGVGLSNVESRIKLYYGQEASVNMQSSKGEGTTVTLNLKTELSNRYFDTPV